MFVLLLALTLVMVYVCLIQTAAFVFAYREARRRWRSVPQAIAIGSWAAMGNLPDWWWQE